MKTDTEILGILDLAFADIQKPDHFTNYQHCEECLEHDDTLRSHDRDTLRLDHVSNAGWDPLCFCSAEGKAYFMPTLIRFALERANHPDWYAHQLLFHLAGDGTDNALYQYCNKTQKDAISEFLSHFIETRANEIEERMCADEFLLIHQRWSA
ncbi:hypothetical protein [Xanthomonas nasturtii]|uniref:hypothetical protein n=1 Tax=Xanthomonas nasturtii TaxID=1843581 RepID=UPI002011316D|nr:hypothetical protein [Xanthomonas nasturtii]MCL1498580.1 hypothetical protein [Xanthomonas nasturtii]MCL1504560.1 hypothetical protein [Xanthomonas nasturtii]MCL1523586.1 hypothetical protein [Xanthomonas nasturtii]